MQNVDDDGFYVLVRRRPSTHGSHMLVRVGRPRTGNTRFVVDRGGSAGSGYTVDAAPGSWERKAWNTAEGIGPLPRSPGIHLGGADTDGLLRIIYQFKLVSSRYNDAGETRTTVAIWPYVLYGAPSRKTGRAYRNTYGVCDSTEDLIGLLEFLERCYNVKVPEFYGRSMLGPNDNIRLQGKVIYVYSDMSYSAHRGDEEILTVPLGIEIRNNRFQVDGIDHPVPTKKTRRKHG